MRNEQPLNNAPERLLSWAQLRPMLGDMGRTTWWRAVKRGDAPKPLRLSPGRVAWQESKIRAYQEAIQARQDSAVG